MDAEPLMTSLRPGYRALVIGASGGIGAALCSALAQDHRCRSVRRLSRSVDGLDVTREEAVARVAADLAAEQVFFDIILCATGALTIDGKGPEKSIRAIAGDAMAAQFALNAIGPALVLKHFSPLLVSDHRALMAFLSARVGSIGDNRLGGWISYRSAKAALNQIVRTAAIEVARSRPDAVLASLHPGTVATSLSTPFASGRDRLAPANSAGKMLAVLDRLGPADSGGFFAYDGQQICW